MSANTLIRNPLWATLLAALVAAMVSLFVFVQGGEAKQVADKNIYEPQIINGEPVPNGKYPFMAALADTSIGTESLRVEPGMNPANSHQLFCGGTLIDQDSVLTAAHCFFNPNTGARDPESIKVLQVIVGRSLLTTSQGQERSVKRVFIHPDYNPKVVRNSAHTFDYDVAVIELSRPVSGIAPIKLATSKQNDLENPGHKATVAGWGSTDAFPACKRSDPSLKRPERMREAQVPIVSDSRADELYEDLCRSNGTRSWYTPRLMVAAGGTGKDSCKGDSGGPLFIARAPTGNGDNDGNKGASSSKYTQIGIVSFSAACGDKGYPQAYTEVNASPIASFIKRAASK